MKQPTLVVLTLLLTSTFSFAQDIITTKEGEDILGKILEISKTEVKYKKFDNLEGPVFTLPKSDILMIRYENGSKEIFTDDEPKSNALAPAKANVYPQGQTDAETIASQKLIYAGKAEKYRRRKNTGATLTVLGGVLFVVGVATLSNYSSTTTYNGSGYGQTTTTGNPELGSIAFLLGATGLGIGIPFWIVGAHNQKKYNNKLESLSFRFNVNPKGSGITLAYRF